MCEMMVMEVLFNFTVGRGEGILSDPPWIPKSVDAQIHSQLSVSIDSATEDSINHG